MFGIGEQTENTVLFIKVFHSKVNFRGLIGVLLFLVFNLIHHEQRVNFVHRSDVQMKTNPKLNYFYTNI